MRYEATIEDPKVFTRPWKMSMPLYRRQERNAQLMDFKCVEFVEELMYGKWRKTPLSQYEGIGTCGNRSLRRRHDVRGGRSCWRLRTDTSRRRKAQAYSPTRMPDGHPDLQGTYDLRHIDAARAAGGHESGAHARGSGEARTSGGGAGRGGAKPISGERAAPPKGGDGSAGAAGNVGGYNKFWLDPGLDVHDRQR